VIEEGYLDSNRTKEIDRGRRRGEDACYVSPRFRGEQSRLDLAAKKKKQLMPIKGGKYLARKGEGGTGVHAKLSCVD